MKVSLVCAISLDGFINKSTESQLDWSGPADKKFFTTETLRTGVAIMGATTFNGPLHGRPLSDRLNVVVTHHPEAVPTADNTWATSISPAEIVAEIEKRGHTEASLIGGGKINALFLAAGLIDEVWLTLTPHYFGSGVPLFDGGPAAEFELLDSKPLEEGELLLHYRVKN